MLKIDLQILRAIEQGVKPKYKIKVYWQEAELYTEDDYLLSVGDLSTSISRGAYEIANTTVTLKNQNYYFSRRLHRERPNNKLVEILMQIAGKDVLLFRGIIPLSGGWTLTEMLLTLNINA